MGHKINKQTSDWSKYSSPSISHSFISPLISYTDQSPITSLISWDQPNSYHQHRLTLHMTNSHVRVECRYSHVPQIHLVLVVRNHLHVIHIRRTERPRARVQRQTHWSSTIWLILCPQGIRNTDLIHTRAVTDLNSS